MTELNVQVEDTIEGMSTIEKLYIETDGNSTTLKFGGPMSWEDENEVLDSRENIEAAILQELRAHKIQIDGMIELLQNRTNSTPIDDCH